MREPWPFQTKVKDATKAALHSGTKAPCIVMPTGSGKTQVAAMIIHDIMKQLGVAEGGKALFLVHREELLYQTEDTLKEIDMEEHAGLIQSGKPGSPWAPIQIAMVQTLANRLDKITWLNPTVIFVDEAHHATANTWRKIIDHFPEAFVIGMTATPARTDDKGLGFIFDKLVMGPTINDLTPDYLSPVKLLAVDMEFIANASSLKAQAEAGKTGPVLAKVVDTWWKHARDKRTIFFAADVSHSRSINDELRSRGIRSIHLDGDTPKEERRQGLKQVKNGYYQCVTNCRLFTEGMDWKEAECVVLATKTKSIVLYMQMIGRCRRFKGEGVGSQVIDCGGNWYWLGLPDEDIEWSLEKGVIRDEVKKAASKARQCDACGYVYPKKEESCPLCGEVPQQAKPVEVDAEVREITERKQSSAPRATKKQLSREIVATKGDFSKLLEVQRKYGYGYGWAKRMQKIYHHAWG